MQQTIGKSADCDATSPRALQEDVIGSLYLINKLFCLRIVDVAGVSLQLTQNIVCVFERSYHALPLKR